MDNSSPTEPFIHLKSVDNGDNQCWWAGRIEHLSIFHFNQIYICMYCMYGSQSSRPEGFLQKKPFFQKTAIMFLGLYLMSSSMVRMNMNMKKRPAPPRKCQMSCLISIAGKFRPSTRWNVDNVLTRHWNWTDGKAYSVPLTPLETQSNLSSAQRWRSRQQASHRWDWALQYWKTKKEINTKTWLPT